MSDYICIAHLGSVYGEPPVVPMREKRRMTAKRDKAKAGRYRGYGAPSRWHGDDSVGCRENLQFAAVVDEPAPEPVEPLAVTSRPFSTADGDNAGLAARERFDVFAVKRLRSQFAVGKWGVRSS